jgi:hypothetical protein
MVRSLRKWMGTCCSREMILLKRRTRHPPFYKSITVKFYKVGLIAILMVHLISSLRYNWLGLEGLKAETPKINRLNRLGIAVIYKIGNKIFDNSISRCTNVYAVYTGTNRGYEFFSPNISPVKVDLAFYSGNSELDLPLQRQESRNKLIAVGYYLMKNIRDEKLRAQILGSISTRLFSLHPGVHSLDIYLNISQISYLDSIKVGEEYTKIYKLQAFTITREKNER